MYMHMHMHMYTLEYAYAYGRWPAHDPGSFRAFRFPVLRPYSVVYISILDYDGLVKRARRRTATDGHANGKPDDKMKARLDEDSLEEASSGYVQLGGSLVKLGDDDRVGRVAIQLGRLTSGTEYDCWFELGLGAQRRSRTKASAYIHRHTCTHARTHAHTHAHTHTNTHTHTHTHTEMHIHRCDGEAERKPWQRAAALLCSLPFREGAPAGLRQGQATHALPAPVRAVTRGERSLCEARQAGKREVRLGRPHGLCR